VKLFNVVVAFTHISFKPVIIAGNGSTVISTDTLQLVGKVQITVAVPADKPVTIPVPAPTLTVASGLLQVIPGLASDNVVELLTHTFSVPVIGAGKG
jgi:hypothetical protein